MQKRNKYLKKSIKYLSGHYGEGSYSTEVLELYQIYEDRDGKLYEMNLGELKEVDKNARN